MLLPLWMLHALQMQMIQKIGLACIFLLATIDILFDILRTVHTVNRDSLTTHAIIWDVLEPTIAVIISCLPSYRALFKHSRSRSAVWYKTLGSEARVGTPRAQRDACRLRSDFAGLELGSAAPSLYELHSDFEPDS